MTNFSIDTSEVNKFAAHLDASVEKIAPEVRAVVKKALQNVKDDARARVSSHPSWRHLAGTINYNIAGNAFFSEGEVGYDDRGQGELAGIYEFGSARRAPHPTLIPAAQAEEERFVQALARVAEALL